MVQAQVHPPARAVRSRPFVASGPFCRGSFALGPGCPRVPPARLGPAAEKAGRRGPPVATRAPDASRGGSRWRATGRGSAAAAAARATPRLPSSATGTARTCSRKGRPPWPARASGDARARCESGPIPMARDRPRLGSTVRSACHAAAALECHRHGSDLQQRKAGGRCSFPVLPSHCYSSVELYDGTDFLCHWTVQNEFRTRYGRGQQ